MNKVPEILKKDIYTFMAVLLECGIEEAVIFKHKMMHWRINQIKQESDLSKYITPMKTSGKNKMILEVKSKYECNEDYVSLVPVCNGEKAVAKQMIPLEYLSQTD